MLPRPEFVDEKLRFLREVRATFKANREFRRQHPAFAVPPLYVLWDAQSHTNFESYCRSGQSAARMYWGFIRDYGGARRGASTPYRVLEWGCGPARIVRHLPALAEAEGIRAEFYATDYNARSIRWARRSVPGVRFEKNDLAPPLPFDAACFDFVYCRSVFTHLSERMHFAWIEELKRVVRPGGLISLSTAGLAHAHRMLPEERPRFDRGELVVRERAPEGKLSYSVFHPPTFVAERLLAGLQILRHDTPPRTQEMWLVKRP